MSVSCVYILHLTRFYIKRSEMGAEAEEEKKSNSEQGLKALGSATQSGI